MKKSLYQSQKNKRDLFFLKNIQRKNQQQTGQTKWLPGTI